jgi:hypothetical protein
MAVMNVNNLTTNFFGIIGVFNGLKCVLESV